MEHYKVKVRIKIINTKIDSSSREAFWEIISQVAENNEKIPTELEYTFKNNFPKELKRKLFEKFNDELKKFENSYEINYRQRILKDYSVIKHRKLNIDDFINSIVKMQQLKNDHFKDNLEYQTLLNKILLASQIDFDISNISYSSLGFNLNIEPLEKAIKLFDNNFEYFYIFLSTYIPQSFLSSLSFYDDDSLLISTSIEYENGLKLQFEQDDKLNYNKQSTKESIGAITKWDKAKWVWSLANGTLLIPVILALIVIFIVFNKLQYLDDIHRKNYEMITNENDRLIQNYHQLIEIQQDVYNNILEKNNKQKK